ncbi:MAG: hypothetical protein JO097_04150 [Acidobacteriaceae bacterium]|nr:hypothetical protein [Acidobacteriaceae bacterium]MBV9767388.1 hypothetical protein [Acidobacteriaceae bacterium]
MRLKPWLFLALLALGTALLLFGIYFYRHRFVRSDADMLALLPHNPGSTIFFVDVKTLRRTGVLGLLAGSKRAEESDYRDFVTQTRFDYTKSVDTIAGSADQAGFFLLVRGRFDWTKLRGYTLAHGGACKQSSCAVPATKPGHWISFTAIQPDVAGVALSSNATSAERLRSPRRGVIPRPMPAEPVWVDVSPALLKNPLALPTLLRIFAISIQSADAVRLSLGPAVQGSAAIFNLRLDAQCPNVAMAEAIRNQLQIETKMLSLELAREHRQPNSADLTGLMTSGMFESAGKRVTGRWPIRKELLNGIE